MGPSLAKKGEAAATASAFWSVFAEELSCIVGDPAPTPEALRGEGQPPESAATNYTSVDALAEPLVALCLSGGGIRSASFGLGVLQGLARFGLLEKFHYLSTVSGGGYIGSFLTAWRSHEGDDARVFQKLNRPAHTDGKEADEVASIRAFSNYLTPHAGVFSPDTWTAIVIIIRNLVLNWMIFAPFFMGALLLPRFCRDLLDYTAFGMASDPWFLTWWAAGAATIGFTCASYGRRRSEAKWLTTGRFLWLVVLPLVAASIFLTARTAVLMRGVPPSGPPAARLGVGFGVVCYLTAWLLASLFLRFKRTSQAAPRNHFSALYDALAFGGIGRAGGISDRPGHDLGAALVAQPCRPRQDLLLAGSGRHELGHAERARWRVGLRRPAQLLLPRRHGP
jgi:hypothetical protein